MSIKTLKSALICILLPFLLFLSNSSFGVVDKKEAGIGVLAIWGEKLTHKMWQPTINYLNKRIPNHHFVLKPLKLDETVAVVQQREIAFILTNPGNYVDLEARLGISRLATLKTKNQKNSSNQFAAVIFTKSDRDDIQSLKDLRNKSFMGVKKKAFGGFQMAWLEFKKRGIDPFEDFSSLEFSGFPQDKVVYAVLSGKVDAGTVRTSTFERMVAERLINLKDFKVINNQTHGTFPFIHSTPLYPEWPIAKLRNTSAELAKAVTIALLELPANSFAAKQASSSGWTVPLDYFPVRNLFQELNLAPYDVVLPTFLERYWLESILFLMIFIQPLLWYVRKLRISQRIDKAKIEKSETEWSNALDFLDEPMYMVDLNDRIIRANQAFYKKVGSDSENAIGRVVTDFTHPEGEESPCKICLARKNKIDSIHILEADDPVNKGKTPLEISVKVIRDKDNQPIGIIQRMRDLTESRKAEKALRRSEALFKELLNSTPDPLIVANSEGTITLVNSEFEKIFGYNRKEIIGQKLEKLVPPQYRDSHVGMRKQYISHPEIRPMGEKATLEGLHKNGEVIPLEINLSPLNIDGENFVVAAIHDISNRIKKEKELKRLASFPAYNPNPIIEFKEGGEITYANPAAFEWFPDIMNLSEQHELFSDINESRFSLVDGVELIRNIIVDNSTFEQKIIYNTETKLYRTYLWDITKLRNLTQKMSYQASHDVLTNLINRREFERRLNQVLEETQHNNNVHSLCFMDLDKFKAVNDSCGHAAGDELLKQLSDKINSTIRETDTFARFGGDEFGLLLLGCPTDKAAVLAEDVRKTVEKFRFHWDGKTFKIGVSIGIVTIDNTNTSTEDLLSAADTACYLAKEQGRNRIHIYEVDSSVIVKHKSETNWMTRINNALDNDGFVLFFQKIASLDNSLLEHYEVLIRMIDDEGNTIPPDSFIPAAERFDIMSNVDSWVLKNTLSIMQQAKYANINFSVNLSGQSLSDLKFMESCIEQITNSNIHPSYLCFEITETAMIENLNNALRSVLTLRGLGCKIALDDFGSGLSSFSYLKNLPVDYLKIDGSLIKDLENDSVNVTMVKSIIHIGHSMGLKTIAEYVENDALIKILRDLGIDFIQGYGVAKPISIEKLIPLETIERSKNSSLSLR